MPIYLFRENVSYIIIYVVGINAFIVELPLVMGKSCHPIPDLAHKLSTISQSNYKQYWFIFSVYDDDDISLFFVNLMVSGLRLLNSCFP